ncbi:hypothetical protein [Holdemania massiliensis]|uniref:hypothetical protein n=1 Tax=Holdemania massiliensis TaxID=1468449 RepID=UPI001F06DE5D|nr:hypothetical protein [Holdemania massiliensis]MCH1942425.1 hypothetical protein [Holdemania massiliensis]
MTYYTPKNFKRGRLIFNRFRPIDLIVFGIGTAVSVISILFYLMGFDGKNPFIIGVLCVPATVTLTLVLPFQVYHNLMEFTLMLFVYFKSQKKFIWEGVYKYEEEKAATDD